MGRRRLQRFDTHVPGHLVHFAHHGDVPMSCIEIHTYCTAGHYTIYTGINVPLTLAMRTPPIHFASVRCLTGDVAGRNRETEHVANRQRTGRTETVSGSAYGRLEKVVQRHLPVCQFDHDPWNMICPDAVLALETPSSSINPPLDRSAQCSRSPVPPQLGFAAAANAQ